MKSTVSVTEAQAKLPKITRADHVTGVMRYNELAAFILPRARMESLLDTVDFLSNPAARNATAEFKAAKVRFHDLEDLD